MKRTADRLFGDRYRWSVLGAGQSQMKVAAQAAAMGGHVRVGLEDNLWLDKGVLAPDQRGAGDACPPDLGGSSAWDIASPDDAREILDLKGGDRVGF